MTLGGEQIPDPLKRVYQKVNKLTTEAIKPLNIAEDLNNSKVLSNLRRKC